MADKAILLVDDEAILLLSLKQALKLRFGEEFRYETALHGAAGLEKVAMLAAEGVDVVLVISDWLMPGMKGDEFLLTVHKHYPNTKLIMLTGHADEAEIAKLAESVELQAFLRKPWNAERLLSIIAGILNEGKGPKTASEVLKN